MIRSLIFGVGATVLRAWGKFWMRLWGCTIASSARINGRPNLWMHRGTLIIGERVAIGSVPGIYDPGTPFPRSMFSTSPTGRIEIGEDSCMAGAVIVSHASVTIGKRVMIGGGTRILDTDFHPMDVVERRYAPLTPGSPIVIEDDVWIGLDVLVCKGVRIGRGSVIGAKSIVTSDIPPMTFAAGAPAKVIRPITG
jgi:acetyltransferase-like isoleucine patch superfamily enzyme